LSSAFDLTVEAGRLVALLEDEGGALTPESEQRLAEYFEAAPDKLGAIAAVVRRLNAEADHFKRLADRATARVKSLRTKRERLRGNARELLIAHRDLTGESAIRGDHFSAHLSRTASMTSPSDPDAWPPEFVSVEEVTKLDRRGALSALRGGAEFEGFSLFHDWSVTLK